MKLQVSEAEWHIQEANWIGQTTLRVKLGNNWFEFVVSQQDRQQFDAGHPVEINHADGGDFVIRKTRAA